MIRPENNFHIPNCGKFKKCFWRNFFFNAQLGNVSIFILPLMKIFLKRSLTALSKNFLDQKQILSFPPIWRSYHSYVLQWEIWCLKNDRICCLGEWKVVSLEEEQDEDNRFTNASFFISEICECFFLEETIIEKSPQNISWIVQYQLNELNFWRSQYPKCLFLFRKMSDSTKNFVLQRVSNS